MIISSRLLDTDTQTHTPLNLFPLLTNIIGGNVLTLLEILLDPNRVFKQESKKMRLIKLWLPVYHLQSNIPSLPWIKPRIV